MKRAHHNTTVLALATASAMIAALVGCTKIDKPVTPITYEKLDSEKNVLINLQVAYKRREIHKYAEFLADDFQFYFDEETRMQQNGTLPVFWTRLEDSTQTEALFESPNVVDIDIELVFDERAKDDVGVIGHENWTYIDVFDTFLEVDLAPEPGGDPEGLTLRVDGQRQRFFFRKGRTATDIDTLTSMTAKNYYLVEWRDFGMTEKPELVSSNP